MTEEALRMLALQTVLISAKQDKLANLLDDVLVTLAELKRVLSEEDDAEKIYGILDGK